ncbi:MAG: hypothetical protein ABEJ22_00910 [Haloferacaceae archaeon]
MRRLLALLFAASLVALPIPAASAASVAYVGDVAVSPEQPLVGERFTVTTTIRNAQTATGPLRISAVAIRSSPDDDFHEYARVSDLGRLPPGADLSVPLSLSFDSRGTRDLRVVVFGRDDDGAVRMESPFLVTVREGGPQLSVDVGDAVVGTATTATVVAANGETEPIRNVRLTLVSEDATVENATWVAPALAAGETRSVAFRTTPTAREGDLTAVLQYVTASGKARRATQSVPFEADPLDVDVSLEAAVRDRGGSPPVEATVSNFGNAPLEGVTVTASNNGTVLARRPLAPVAPDASRTVLLNVTGVSAARLDVTASFESGGESGSVATAVRYAASPGRVELTGIDLTREDGTVHVAGSASNVGLSEARGVVLRVLPADGVRPARPYRDFFVGTVPASDFVSFDLYADVDPGVTSIPVEVSYLVDGERVTTVQSVDVSDLPTPTPDRQSGGSLPLVGAGAVVVLAVALIGAVVLYRRR